MIPFWVLIGGYFMILEWVSPIPAPYWLYRFDQNIPFLWWMVIPYYFHYIGLVMPPFIIFDQEKLTWLVKINIFMTLLCYFFFVFWPISADRVWVTVTPNILDPLYRLIIHDGWAQNSFPSMHVAVSGFLSLIFMQEFQKYKWIIFGVGCSIFCSTFLIKQHYVLDSIAGLFIGILGYLYFKKRVN